MTKLAWDAVGERIFEAGVDRGVLYHPDDGALAWNGLVSVTENTNRARKPYFLDGIKYMEAELRAHYTAKISAFTYPDELEKLTGIVDVHTGARVHDQPSRSFHLSYRTGIGDDLNPERGYKIHVVYNVTAIISDREATTRDDSPEAVTFEWDISAMPAQLAGYGWITHLSFDSRELDPVKLTAIENQLYGTPTTDGVLPYPNILLALAA